MVAAWEVVKEEVVKAAMNVAVVTEAMVAACEVKDVAQEPAEEERHERRSSEGQQW